MKLPTASRSSRSRTSRITRNIPSVSPASTLISGGRSPTRRGRASSPWSQARHGAPLPGAGASAPAPQHARQVLAEHLAGIAGGDARAVPAFVQPARQRAPKALRHGRGVLGDAHGPQQLQQALPVAAQAGEPVLLNGLARDLVRDEG